MTFGYNSGQYSTTPAGGFLTSNGTVLWSSSSTYGYGASVIYNAGLWESVSDGNLTIQNGTNYFINTGTLAKVGSTGTSTIGWSFSSLGVFNTASRFVYPELGRAKRHPGDVKFSGTISIPAVIASNAVVNWLGGDVSGGSLTVAQGGLLTISNTVTLGYNSGQYSSTPNGGFLTNNGTVIWSSSSTYGYGASVVYNAGLWESVSDGNLSNQSGTNHFINAGILEKIGGSGTSTRSAGLSAAPARSIQWSDPSP